MGYHGRASGSLGPASFGVDSEPNGPDPLSYGHAHGDLIENGEGDYVAVALALRLSPARKCVAKWKLPADIGRPREKEKKKAESASLLPELGCLATYIGCVPHASICLC